MESRADSGRDAEPVFGISIQCCTQRYVRINAAALTKCTPCIPSGAACSRACFLPMAYGITQNYNLRRKLFQSSTPRRRLPTRGSLVRRLGPSEEYARQAVRLPSRSLVRLVGCRCCCCCRCRPVRLISFHFVIKERTNERSYGER